MDFTCSKIEEMNLVLGKTKKMGGSNRVSNREMVGWVKPPAEWVKFNVDGASQWDGKQAEVGCVARNCNSTWLMGEARNIGLESSITSELLAIYFGLKLAWRKGYMKIILELDSAVVVDLVLGTEE